MEYEFKYQLTQKADDDLEDILSYIAVELGNTKAASDFMDKLQSAVNEARTFPQSGSPVISDFFPDNKIRKKILGNYIMYYLPNFSNKTIYVLRIVYGRRNVNEILRQLDL